MESARLSRAGSSEGVRLGHIQIGLIVTLLIFAVLAWVVTGDRMHAMDAGPGTDLGGAGWFIGVWVVMMAAMMFPSIAPMVVMYGRIQEGKRERGQPAPAGATAIFVAGYLVSWSAAGLLGYAIVELVRSLDPAFLAWTEGGQYVAAAVILAAAIYQLTPFKDVCLRKCRHPLVFLLTAWRPGRSGALRMGIEHGGWCVGCCWALMAALFALGVMSLGWMALIAALIAAEKLLPWQAIANRGVALVLVALAIGVAAAPSDVPGLTVPGSPEAERAMDTMGMDQGSMDPDDPVASPDEAGEGGAMGGEGMGDESGREMESEMGGGSMGSGQMP
jgi:predicted metal-binding membrane protein